MTIDKVCLSEMEAVMVADLLLRSGLATVAVAGGPSPAGRHHDAPRTSPLRDIELMP